MLIRRIDVIVIDLPDHSAPECWGPETTRSSEGKTAETHQQLNINLPHLMDSFGRVVMFHICMDHGPANSKAWKRLMRDSQNHLSLHGLGSHWGMPQQPRNHGPLWPNASWNDLEFSHHLQTSPPPPRLLEVCCYQGTEQILGLNKKNGEVPGNSVIKFSGDKLGFLFLGSASRSWKDVEPTSCH